MAKAASKKAASGSRSSSSAKPPAKGKPAKVAIKVHAKAAPKAKQALVVKKAKLRPAPPPPPAAKHARRAVAADTSRHPAHNGPVGPLPPPIPTNDKPRKNQAGMTSRELEHFRDLLLAKRREILGDMSSMEREALRTSGGSNLSTLPIHMADMGTDNYEQEFTLGLVETERKLLREINNALAKIQNGNFGICEGTGKPISKARLEVAPWARYSIEYAKQLERGGR